MTNNDKLLYSKLAKIFTGDIAHIKAYKLKPKHFSKYIIEVNNLGHSIQYIVKFKNGYGASITKEFIPMRSNHGEDWKITLLRFDENDEYHVIFFAIRNRLSRHDVRRVLAEIRKVYFPTTKSRIKHH